MMASRGMGAVRLSKIPKPKIKRRKDGDTFTEYAAGGKVSKVNEAGNYTNPGMRKKLFEQIKASATQGTKAGNGQPEKPNS